MGVQIETAHETCLRGMRVDPAQGKQVTLILELEQCFLVRRRAGIGGGRLSGDKQVSDDKRVVALRS
jgi:hypothetical protein